MKEKIKEQIQFNLQNLEIKKFFKIKENGNKVKVRRNDDNAYSIYLNGNFITTDTTWQEVFELVLVLINS